MLVKSVKRNFRWDVAISFSGSKYWGYTLQFLQKYSGEGWENFLFILNKEKAYRGHLGPFGFCGCHVKNAYLQKNTPPGAFRRQLALEVKTKYLLYRNCRQCKNYITIASDQDLCDFWEVMVALGKDTQMLFPKTGLYAAPTFARTLNMGHS